MAEILDEIKDKKLENRKAVSKDLVKNGQLTQEQADTMIKNMETNIANCTGIGMNGYACSRQGQGAGGIFGRGRGGMAAGDYWVFQEWGILPNGHPTNKRKKTEGSVKENCLGLKLGAVFYLRIKVDRNCRKKENDLYLIIVIF
ncbi:MAG: DUF2680 domain-containing protein [Peptococcaceae bacterium]|nr:DUF2680 domain-containing protein [Peptococcaceae bacterium]